MIFVIFVVWCAAFAFCAFASDCLGHEHRVVDGELRKGVCRAIAFGINNVVDDSTAGGQAEKHFNGGNGECSWEEN